MTITRNSEVGKAAASPVPPPVAPELSRRGFLGTALAGGLSAAIAPLSAQPAAGTLIDEQAQRAEQFAEPSADLLRDTGLSNIATLEAYERAVNLWAVTDGKTRNSHIVPHWLPDGKRFWYVATRQGGRKEYLLVDMPAGTRMEAFNHFRLADSLGRLEREKINAHNLNITITAITDTAMAFNMGKRGYNCQLGDYTVTRHALWKAPAIAPAFAATKPNRWSAESAQSPDGRWVVHIRDFNVYLKSAKGQREQQLTHDGSADNYFEPRVFWASDSRKFLVLRTIPGFDRQVRELDYAVPENEAKLVSFFYQKPGDKVAITRPHLFDVSHAKEIPLSTDLT